MEERVYEYEPTERTLGEVILSGGLGTNWFSIPGGTRPYTIEKVEQDSLGIKLTCRQHMASKSYCSILTLERLSHRVTRIVDSNLGLVIAG